MVTCGFSLFDLRKLYLDELFYFYDELFYTLEKRGDVKEGTYDKIKAKENNQDDRETVKSLRRQLFRVVADKKL